MDETIGENRFKKIYKAKEFVREMGIRAENGEFSASSCCVFFRLVGFRKFYMTNGFDEGYEVLKFTGNKINNAFPVDPVTRLEDGEYAVLTDIEDVEIFIKRIQQDFNEVYIHTGMKLVAGIYPIASDDADVEIILTRAQLACDQNQGENRSIAVFKAEKVDRSILMQHYVVHHLDKAVENEEISIYYQPIFHTLSGKVCGFEALARWNDKEYGILKPMDFVPVLENARKIHILDSYVIKQVCIDQKNVLDSGMEPVPVSVNLTHLDFALMDMLSFIEEQLSSRGLSRDLLVIEISEAEIVTDRTGIKRELKKFHDKGYHITFDDFGSEYSSFHILNDMPFDTIKINSSFLSGFNNDLNSRVMMKNIVNMSKELGITTMMGSVEDDEILEFLKQTGCEKTQGHLYSEAHPIRNMGGQYKFEFENNSERKFYERIGQVNILSQTPIDTHFSYLDSEATYLNQLPLAIFEFEDGRIRMLMSSQGFNEIFRDMLSAEGTGLDDVFNSQTNQFSKQIRKLAAQCAGDDEIHPMEFVTEQGYHRIMLRRISVYDDLGKTAILAIAENITENDPGTRAMILNSSLRFLYMIYTSVNIVNAEDDTFEVVYANNSNYSNDMQKGTFSEAIQRFADSYIYNEDREKFIEFYNLETLRDRFIDINADHITDYFRTKDVNGEYDWLMYLIIPVTAEGVNKFIMCSRTIEAERMRKLPEISQSGDEYYDMPSDPIFLLLASDAFTDTLGYGSFEQFIRSTFYLEASLTDDRTVYMHLGQSGLISDFGETGYISLPFGEVSRGMVFSQVVEEDQPKMYRFYDRDRLLSEYEKGRITGSIVYLEKGLGEHPRYQNACYHIRKSRENDNIHIYILKYDIDDFKRTTERIRFLAERDTLTGLYNRLTIGGVIDSFLKKEDTTNLAFVLLDLDYFKQVNDGYGHDCGDMVIKDAAERMIKYMGEDSYPARIGGDEFLVAIRNASAAEVDKILADFSGMDKKVEYAGQTVRYTMSIGYAMYPDDADNYTELYQKADLALYDVKMNGKNNYRGYFKGIESQTQREEMGFNPATVSDILPGGLLVYKAGDKEEIIYANKQLIDLYECDSYEDFKDFTGNSFKGCVHKDDYELIEKEIKEEIVKDDTDFGYVRYRAVTKSGKVITIEDFGRLKHNADKDDLFYVFMIDYDRKHMLYQSIIDEIRRHWKDV